jgi:hypothetical protein
MHKRIVLINPAGLGDLDIQQVCNLDPELWQHYKIFSRIGVFPTTRFGQNTLPFENNLIQFASAQAPLYRSNFDQTWADVSDSRYHELRRTHFDQPWLIFWSGGIDSTTILTSILRNSTQQDRQNITVVCNDASIAEAPRFFLNHVQPNFSIISSENIRLDRATLNSYYLVNGHPADPLWCQLGGRIPNLVLTDPGFLEKPVTDDDLIEAMTRLFKTSEDFAQWWYSIVQDNIQSQGIPVETMHDFFWYSAFNFSWAGTKVREWLSVPGADVETIQLFRRQAVFWFDTVDYQQWSMNNNRPGVKYGSKFSDYKWAAKQYIHQYDGDDYYLYFKHKVSSDDYKFYKKDDRQFFCMLDDWSCLYLPQDLETIQSLMTDFVR